MQVSMNTRGNEMYVDSKLGRYTAHAPVTPDEDGKMEVITPSGKIVRMTQSEWLRVIAVASTENGLVRQPRTDCFTHEQ